MTAVAVFAGRLARRRARTAPPPAPEPERDLPIDLDWVPFRAACPERVDVTVELFRRGMERAAARRGQ